MAKKTTTSKLDKVTVKDWLFALIGLFFTLAGVVIFQKDFQTGITTLVFFGSCFTVAVYIILRKLRLQRQSPLAVSVAGGVPIRPSRSRLAMLGLGLLVVGIILAAFSPGDNPILFGLAWLIAFTGGLLGAGLVTGHLPKAYIQFDPSGLTLGYRAGKAIIPWSAITDAARGDIHNNQAVFIRVASEAVTAEPRSYLARIRKQMASSRTWTGADFVIMSSLYGMDSPILLAAIERYAFSSETRAELASPRPERSLDRA
jgi:hypothetical protein